MAISFIMEIDNTKQGNTYHKQKSWCVIYDVMYDKNYSFLISNSLEGRPFACWSLGSS